MLPRSTLSRWVGIALPVSLVVFGTASPGGGAPAPRARTIRRVAPSPLAQARRAASEHRYADAEKLLRARLKARPSDEGARFLLARVLVWQGKSTPALAEYDRLLKTSPRNADYLLGKGQALAQAGRDAQALLLLRQARGLAPRYEDVYRLEAQVLSRLGQKEALSQLVAVAARRFPQSDWKALASAGTRGIPAAPVPQAQSAVEKAQVALGKGQLDEAAKLLRRRLAQAAADQEARFLLARVLAWQRKPEEALAEYDRLLAAAPANVDYLVGKAQVLLWLEKLAEALRVLDQAKRISPRYEDIYRLQVMALRRAGDARALSDALAEAQRLFPDAAWAVAPASAEPPLVAHARQAIANKDLSQAERLLRDYVRQSPADEPARFLLARVLTWQGKAPNALVEYDFLLHDSPQNVDYLIGKAQALLSAGKPADALPLLQAAKGMNPNGEESYRLELQALAETGEREKLAAARQEALRLFPGAAWAQLPASGEAQGILDARATIREHKLDRAELQLRDWLKTHDTDEDARALLARVLSWQGKSTDALAEYDRLLTAAPDSADYLVGKAYLLLWSRKPEEAVPLAKRAVTINPRDEDAYRLLIQALAAAGDRDELARVRADAARLFPQSDWPEVTPQPLSEIQVLAVRPTTEDVQAWSAIRQAVDARDNERAAVLVREWLKRYPRDDSARFVLARLLLWQGKPDEAIKETETLLARDAKNADALLVKAQAMLRLGRLEDAVRLLEEARETAPEYEDLYVAEAQALQRLGDKEKLETLRKESSERFPNAPWVAQLAPSTATAGEGSREAPTLRRPRLLEMELGYAVEALTGARADWRTFSIDGKADLGRERTLGLSLTETERFGLSDHQIAGTLAHRLGSQWALSAEGSFSPTHQVLPTWSARLAGERKLGGGWVASLGARHTEYRASSANGADLTLERYWGHYRGALSISASNASGAGSGVGPRVRLDRTYGEHSFLGLEAALGREPDSLGDGKVVQSAILGLHLLGRHWVRPTWALTYGLGWQRQGTLYQRSGIQLGVRNSF